jgi:flavin reductase (DIM6/NTAB) family NADH-FMN oxidoreductase RutF
VQLIVPRPIAWVGSRGPDGQDNLAPFSYFMGVSSEPPMLAISVARGRGGARKHTALNLLHGGQFTVSMPEERDLDAMHATSAPFEESEFDAVGVARAEGARVAAPYVAGARIVMECRVSRHLDLGQVDLFVGEVVYVHVHDSLVRDGALDPDAPYRPIARLGGDRYAGLGPVFSRAPARVPSRS